MKFLFLEGRNLCVEIKCGESVETVRQGVWRHQICSGEFGEYGKLSGYIWTSSYSFGGKYV